MREKKNTYWVRIIRIALPIIISNLVGQLQMLIDKIFLGRLQLECMSAVGNATGPVWTSMTTLYSLALGGTILISQAIGAEDKEKAKRIMATMFKYNNIPAIFWFVFWMLGARMVFQIMGVHESVIDMSVSYARFLAPIFILNGIGVSVTSMLQVCEKTKILAVQGVIRSGLNIILDYCLIFGNFGFPAMGVAGAALATTIAEYAGSLVLICYALHAKDLIVKPSWADIVKAKAIHYLSAVKIGIPSALEEFAWNFGNIFLVVMLNRVSAVAAGVYAIIFSVELLPVTVFNGLGQATVTLSGQETGRGNTAGVRKLVGISVLWSVLLSSVILSCFILFPHQIMKLFTTDQAVIAASTWYLIIVGIDIFPKAINIIVGSGIKGYGNTLWMLKTQLVGTVFVIAGSSILVLVLHQGMDSIFWLVVADETLRGILNTIHLKMR